MYLPRLWLKFSFRRDILPHIYFSNSSSVYYLETSPASFSHYHFFLLFKMGQSLIPPTPEGATLAGQTIIITGGGSGLGFETARQFLTLKASRVIIAVRSTSKGQEAVAALKANPAVKAANPNAVVEAFELDLEDYESGLRFTQRIKSEVKELDILLCNGGITVIGYHPSKSSHEITMQGKSSRKSQTHVGQIKILTTLH